MLEGKVIFNDGQRDEITKAVNEVLNGGELRIASAFLGKGAEKKVKKGARLLCDVGMGGTNPDALSKISVMLGENLRCLPHFHPKLYISSTGCVIGSANLSNNGIGFLSAAKLVEAATFLPKESPCYEAASCWYEEIWKCAEVVGDSHIELARNAWKKNKFSVPDVGLSSDDFVEGLKNLPTGNNGWRVVVTYEGLSEEANQTFNEMKEDVATEHNLLRSKNIIRYEWRDDWGDRSQHVIGVYLGPRGGVTIRAYRYLTEQKLKNGNGLYLFETLNWQEMGLPTITDEYKGSNGILSKMIEAKKRKGKWNGKFFTGAEFAKKLESFLN